jgi:hypothetical protein
LLTVSCEFCCFVEDLLGAAPTKAAALITFLALAAAALLVTGTFGLALSSGGQGTGRAAAARSNEMGCLAGVEASDQAAIELQVSFALLL